MSMITVGVDLVQHKTHLKSFHMLLLVICYERMIYILYILCIDIYTYIYIRSNQRCLEYTLAHALARRNIYAAYVPIMRRH